MKRRPQLEALEDRRLVTAALPALPAPVLVGNQQPAVVGMAAAAPRRGISILGRASCFPGSATLPHSGIHSNHNQTLLRVRRRKGASR
jgi:hypothetical protein